MNPTFNSFKSEAIRGLIAGMMNLGARTLFILVATCSLVHAAREKPNVVFFLVDDLGWADVSCFGSSFYETKHIDRLAKEGVRFTNAYAACQVCSPTRASILTGKYPARVQITDFINPAGKNQPEQWKRNTPLLPAPYQDHLALEETTLAEALRESGYRTFFAGKWHLGNEGFYPEDQGFEVNQGGIEKGGPYGGKRYFSPYGNPRLTDGPEGEHLPDRLASEAVKFIETHQDEPFLTYVSFYSVHTPLISREDLREKYQDKKTSKDHQGPRFRFKDGRPERVVQDHPTYAGMVEAMDLAIGKVLDALDRLDLAKDTVVFFTSDNGGLSTSEGWPTSNAPLRAGKGWIYEGGIREPTIVRWPGVAPAGTVCEEPLISPDFYPTILQIAGLPQTPEQGLDGKSFVASLKGRPQARGPIFWHYPHYGNQGGQPAGAVREGDWKLIHYYHTGENELYHLRSDLSETKRLDQEEPKIVASMKQKLDAWLSDTGAVLPSKNPAFDPAKVPQELEAWKARHVKLEEQHAKF